MTQQNHNQDNQQSQKGNEPSHEEREWTQDYEKENFGHVLERDVNGDPVK